MKQMTRKQFAQYVPGIAAATGAVLLTSQPVMAQTTEIDDLTTELGKVQAAADAIIPVAIGAAVFGIGLHLIRRFSYG